MKRKRKKCDGDKKCTRRLEIDNAEEARNDCEAHSDMREQDPA